MKNCLGLLAASLLLSLPGFSQTAPLGQFAPIPILQFDEVVVGLAPLNSQLALVTTYAWYTSPLAPTAGAFTSSQGFQAFNVYATPQTQVTGNPTNSAEFWITGGGGRAGYLLYKVNLTPPGTRTSVAISGFPQSLASDGTNAYMVLNGQVLKVDASTGNILPVTFASVNPQQVAHGPDGLIYVLDATSASGQILVFDTNGVVKSSFQLDQPSVYQAGGPMAVSSNGQLYLQTTDSSGTLSIDSYNTQTGAFLGRTSGAGTFSADQNINPGGHAAMYTTDGNLYYTTGTGTYVWLFSTGPRTPTALDCHGASVSSLTHQYGSMAKAAAALGYPSVSVLQLAVRVGCGN